MPQSLVVITRGWRRGGGGGHSVVLKCLCREAFFFSPHSVFFFRRAFLVPCSLRELGQGKGFWRNWREEEEEYGSRAWRSETERVIVVLECVASFHQRPTIVCRDSSMFYNVHGSGAAFRLLVCTARRYGRDCRPGGGSRYRGSVLDCRCRPLRRRRASINRFLFFSFLRRLGGRILTCTRFPRGKSSFR